MLDIVYLGNATFSISSGGTTALIDPYIAENEECPWDVDEVMEREDPDVAFVTHAAHDHLGDALELATEYGLPIATEPASAYYLRANGVPESQVSKVISGMTVDVGDLSVRVLEARHASAIEVNGHMTTGVPLSFMVSGGDSTAYHMGDTSIFSDLKLFGELYEPDVVLIGVGQAYDAAATESKMVPRKISELSTEEAILAATWLGCDRAVPMHYLPDELERFLAQIRERDDAPEAVPLDPGESLSVE